jgi:hypothetical protein
MKSMTIHGIDAQLAELIKSKAESEGLSINKTIKKLLETSLGIKPRPPQKNLDDFKEFCGIWTEAELKEFEEKTSDTSVIDPEDWQ